MFLAFLTVVNIFYIPMKLAFGIKDGQNDLSAYLLDEIPSWAFVLDIIINFNTAFYDQGMINSSRKTIILHYIRGDFILDFIVISVFFVSKYQIPYIDFVLLLRVTRYV
jgi:potassium voltage-gated channel Eag-related subfamily H protein 5